MNVVVTSGRARGKFIWATAEPVTTGPIVLNCAVYVSSAVVGIERQSKVSAVSGMNFIFRGAGKGNDVCVDLWAVAGVVFGVSAGV